MNRTSVKKQSGRKSGKKAVSPVKLGLVSVALVILMSFLITFGSLLIYIIVYVNGKTVINLDDYKNSQSQTTIVYATNTSGKTYELTRLHGTENRIWVDSSNIPKAMQNAFIALEDKRFNQHNGVDWTRTMAAIFKYGGKQGGSTITQQLIKNLTDEKDVTFVRKFNEILNALNIERKYSKDDIMEAYLNTLYLGEGCYGVMTASETYFGKSVKDLNIAECATLASITQFPNKYDPLINPKANKTRQEYCLKQMYDQGKITEQQYDDAVNYKLVFTNSPNYIKKKSTSTKKETAPKTYQNYYIDYVIDNVVNDLCAQYGYSTSQATHMIYYGGLKIYAAVDTNVQSALEDVYVNRKEFPGDSKLQSAMVVMDYSGRIAGIVGGAGKKTENRSLNRATQSVRQPGSSIKPLTVYSPAIEYNTITWSTMIQDKAITVNGQLWPQNSNGSHGTGGYITVQNGLARSLNTIAVRVEQKLGPQRGFDFAQDKFHLSTLVADGKNSDVNLSSMAVGGMSQGVTVLDMTAAYASFGDGGMYNKPYSYYKVTDSSGKKIILQGSQKPQRALSKDTADVMNELLQANVTDSQGTGRFWKVPNMPTFGKTGSTSDYKDLWFVGGTPYYVAGVWFGYDTPKRLTISSNPSGKIFQEVMTKINKNLETKDFVSNGDAVERRYCLRTGDLASSSCRSTAVGWYKKSDLPSVCSSCKGGSGKYKKPDDGKGNETPAVTTAVQKNETTTAKKEEPTAAETQKR